MTEEQLFTEYPVLKNVQVDFVRKQIIEAFEKAKKNGKIEAYNDLRTKPVLVNKKPVKGKVPEYYLSSGFIDGLISEL